MRERHKYARNELVTPVDVRLPHRDGWVPAFRGNTLDVSAEGLTVALYEGYDTTELIRSLLSEGQSGGLALELPPTDERITAEGVVKWLDIGPVAASQRYLRVGIFLGQMSDEDRAKWTHFVEDRARMARGEAVTV